MNFDRSHFSFEFLGRFAHLGTNRFPEMSKWMNEWIRGLPQNILKFLPDVDMIVDILQLFFQTPTDFLEEFFQGSGSEVFGDVGTSIRPFHNKSGPFPGLPNLHIYKNGGRGSLDFNSSEASHRESLQGASHSSTGFTASQSFPPWKSHALLRHPVGFMSV